MQVNNESKIYGKETEIDAVREWIFPSKYWNDCKIYYYGLVQGIKVVKFWLQSTRQFSEYDSWRGGDLMPIIMTELHIENDADGQIYSEKLKFQTNTDICI